jgi:hypothetical protein
MKKLIVVTAMAGVLSACGSTGKQYSQFNEQNARQEKYVTQAIDRAPEWMTRLPKSENAIYQSADESGASMSSAKMFAEAKAYAKICTAAGGKVRSQVKMFRSDSGDSSTDQSEMVLRSMCPDVDITGVETVEMKHVSEGNRIRTYVLVTLPIGDKNVLKSAKDAEARAPGAFKELDNITNETKKGPTVTEPADKKADKVSVINPDGTEGSVTLLSVNNEDYKARRAEALKKPGAVISQHTIQSN